MKQFFEEYSIQTPLPNSRHNEYGLFTEDIEIIARKLHKTIDDFNNPDNWPQVLKIRDDWFNG
jgi:hypothetical protein